MRNIAANSRKPGSQQNLQQFVSNSNWSWEDIRRRMARILCQNIKVTSWVISPLIIPKAGKSTVGVETQFISHKGKLINCQRAIGIWLAGPGVNYPMDWQLVLPPTWTDDPSRRHRAAIPTDVTCTPSWKIEINKLITIINDWGLPVRPVIMDAREGEATVIIRELQRLHIPFIVRVNRSTRFTQTGQNGTPRGGDGEYSAEALAESLKEQRRVVQRQGSDQRMHQGVLANAVYIDLPDGGVEVDDPSPAFNPAGAATPPGKRELVLIVEWRDSVHGKPSCWVSNITHMSVSSLLNCANMAHQVYLDQERISRNVGLYDFEGRSFTGWHRHVTLVSAAHAFVTLNSLHMPFKDSPEVNGTSFVYDIESPWQEN